MTNQLDLRAGTKFDDNFKSSGKTKQAKATVNNSIGIAIDGIIGDWYSLSINSCPIVVPQVRKYRDSYKLLTGKCPEINHLKSNCSVMNKFTKVVNSLTVKDDFFLKTAPRDIGKLTNKIKKTNRPKIETGSYIKFLKISFSNISEIYPVLIF